MGGSSEYSKESLGSTECQEFPDCTKPTGFSTQTSIQVSHLYVQFLLVILVLFS